MKLTDKCECKHERDLHYQIVNNKLNHKGSCNGAVGTWDYLDNCKCKKFVSDK